MYSRRKFLGALLALPVAALFTKSAGAKLPGVSRVEIFTWRQKAVNDSPSDLTIYDLEEGHGIGTIFRGYQEIWEKPDGARTREEVKATKKLVYRKEVRKPHIVSNIWSASQLEGDEDLLDTFEAIKALDPYRIVYARDLWNFIILDPFY